MTVQSSTTDDGLRLSLRTNLFLGDAEMGSKILGALIDTGGIFVPEVFDGGSLTGGRVKFDPADVSLPLKAWTTDRYESGIIAERKRPLKMFFHVTTTDFTMFDHLSLAISLDRKRLLDQRLVDRFLKNIGIEKLVEFGKKMYKVVSPNWGYIANEFYEHTIGHVFDTKGRLIGYDAPKDSRRFAIQGLFWANFFGPDFVEMFGREKLLA